MIDSVITRKITSNCSHVLPVVVTCIECSEVELRKWEARIREDYKRTVHDEFNELETQLKRARQQTATLQDANDRLSRTIAKLDGDKRRLMDLAKENKTQIDNMSAQLHAEQAGRQKLPMLPVAAE